MPVSLINKKVIPIRDDFFIYKRSILINVLPIPVRGANQVLRIQITIL